MDDQRRMEEIAKAIAGLKVGDTVSIRVAGDEMSEGWEEHFQICGVSDHYALAFHDETYTIIHKEPTEYPRNGIPKGMYVCAPDYLLFGYAGGYHFDDPAWVKQYLQELEVGVIEPSVRKRGWITKLEQVAAE